MIEINGIYKLKKIKNFHSNDDADYKVIAFGKHNIVLCNRLENGVGVEQFVFFKDFLIDPEKPEEIYADLIFENVENS